MGEQAGFEARAVLAPRRPRVTRLALLLPAVALVATAWAGASGTRPNEGIADFSEPTAAGPSITVDGSTAAVAPEARRPEFPAQVVGLDVQRLDHLEPAALGRDDVVAVAGWYVATAITDCPPLAALYRRGSLPEVRGDADEWAFCERSGLLYASRPELQDRMATTNPEDNGPRDAGLQAVAVTLVVGVVVPRELEMIGAAATPVVVVGRFVNSGEGCLAPADCRRDLVVDHLAWAAE
jgi:hypothetical protein